MQFSRQEWSSSPNNQYYRIGVGIGSLSLMGKIELGQTVWDVFSYSMVVLFRCIAFKKHVFFFEISKILEGVC